MTKDKDMDGIIDEDGFPAETIDRIHPDRDVDPPERMPHEIAIALVKAQAHASAVEKTSANTFHRYRYASAESIITEARACLAHAGLGVLAEGWEVESSEPHDRLVVQYLVVHDSGLSWHPRPTSTPIIPEKGRPQDKAEATALTYNLGYFQRSLLNLPRVEEGTDVDQRDDNAKDDPGKPAGAHDPSEILQKGKHKGTAWKDVDSGYLDWASTKASGQLQSRAKAELKRRKDSNGADDLKARLAERKESRDDQVDAWDDAPPPEEP
jgi:hypothetical protein